MRPTPLLALIIIATIALAGCGNGDDPITTDDPESRSSVTVDIQEQGGSGVMGTAILTDDNGQTDVNIEVFDPEVGAARPAHIHPGTCADLSPDVEHGLDDVVDGQSQSTVNVSVDDLVEGEFAINLHESADAIDSYIACGDIGNMAGAGATDDFDNDVEDDFDDVEDDPVLDDEDQGGGGLGY